MTLTCDYFSLRLQLADVEESMVRKAAVFCIVKLYFVMGEDKVKPKFALLNASKVRWVVRIIQTDEILFTTW